MEQLTIKSRITAEEKLKELDHFMDNYFEGEVIRYQKELNTKNKPKKEPKYELDPYANSFNL